MPSKIRIIWLRRVLVIKVFLTVFVWGLPALFGPQSLLDILGLPVPVDLLYLRLFGGMATAWGVAYWFAYKDPVHNSAIIKAGLIDNILPTVTVIVLGLTRGISSIFIWISALFTGIFFVLFLVLIPREFHPVET